MYHGGSRELQERFDTVRLADRLEEKFGSGVLTPERKAFIESLDMFFLATADAGGRPQCSYKGGEPGFVRVLDERTLAFPVYDGNGMFMSAGNVVVNPHVGLLFIDFTGPRQTRLRVNGKASVHDDTSWPGAQFAIHVAVREAFPNCPRYVHRFELVERSRFVPDAHGDAPVPDWKRADWARDVLPRE